MVLYLNIESCVDLGTVLVTLKKQSLDLDEYTYNRWRE